MQRYHNRRSTLFPLIRMYQNNMKRKTCNITTLAGIAIVCCFGFHPREKSIKRSINPADQTLAVVKATNAFLNTLNAEQRAKLVFPFKPQSAAVAAKFAQTGSPGATPSGEGNKADRPPGEGMPPQGGPPGGRGGNGGQFSGFTGEQYGQAVWSNFPVSFTQRPGVELGSLDARQRAAATRLLKVLLSTKGYEKVQEIIGSDEALAKGGTDFVAGADHYLIAIFGTPGNTKP